jgi:7-carboxy-7-deazaguanine synthase
MARLRITEIFHSLQGESATVGWPTVFIRLTGCPLRCTYCDTAYAFSGGDWWDVDDIIAETRRHPVRHVTVTGGEPLAQPDCRQLLSQLCDAGYQVSLETSGALDVSEIDERVSKVVDLKTPSSGESGRNLFDNIDHLDKNDQVKFVIGDEQDYAWSREQVDQLNLSQRCTVLFSPVADSMPAATLADWVLRDGLDVRFQIQLHKALWGNEPGR